MDKSVKIVYVVDWNVMELFISKYQSSGLS